MFLQYIHIRSDHSHMINTPTSYSECSGFVSQPSCMLTDISQGCSSVSMGTATACVNMFLVPGFWVLATVVLKSSVLCYMLHSHLTFSELQSIVFQRIELFFFCSYSQHYYQFILSWFFKPDPLFSALLVNKAYHMVWLYDANLLG